MTSEEATASPRASRDPLTSETTETAKALTSTPTLPSHAAVVPYDPDEAPTVPLPVAVPVEAPRPAGDTRTGPGAAAADECRPAGPGRHRGRRRAGRGERRAATPEGGLGKAPASRPEKPEKQPKEKKAARGRAAAVRSGAVGGGAVRPPKTQKAKAPARTGLLGASAAVAIGAVAMVSGLLPGNPLTVGDSSGGGRGGVPGGQVRADAPIEVPPGARPGQPPTAGHTGPTVPVARPGTAGGTAYDRGSARSLVQAVARTSAGRPPAVAETTTASTVATAPSRPSGASGSSTAASAAAAARVAVDAHRRDAAASARLRADRADQAAETGARASAEAAADTRGAAARTVVALVNAERAKAGCRPLHTDARLTSLAQSMSEDMARRGFFDHTDPDGRSPWDRAARHGVRNLGGENIARGHADAHAVVDAWMRSSGHRQNILNCDYRTLGVGVQQGAGGPWWTQDFGY
ncbi:CAP domain-containing protein [Streptomyces mobaraensis]|nr:CAP domain-containing protein [Streptomyces mobaraensis]